MVACSAERGGQTRFALDILTLRRWAWVPACFALTSVCTEDGGLDPFPLVMGATLLLVTCALPFGSVGVSMWPSLGARSVGVLGLPWCLRRGDLCVVLAGGRGLLVKRLVAVGGERVERHGGRVRVDGHVQALAADTTQIDLHRREEHIVPAGHVWVLGEHACSVDSRQLGPVPRARIVGPYWPLVHWGRPKPVLLADPDLADVAFLRGLHPPCPHLDQLEAVLAGGECTDGVVRLVLRWCLLAAGFRDRLAASLERGLTRSADADERALFAVLLVRCLVDQGDLDGAIGFLEHERELGLHPVHGRTLAETRASILARTGRYDEALAAAAQVEERFGVDGFLAGRLSALIGLGRLAEAEAELGTITARGAWGQPCWEPWYRACLASRSGDQARAAALLAAALDAGFPDLGLVRTSPHLAGLRAGPEWPALDTRVGTAS